MNKWSKKPSLSSTAPIRRTSRLFVLLLILLGLVTLVTLFFRPGEAVSPVKRTITSEKFGEYTIVSAGDIAQEGGEQARTADLVKRLHPDRVLSLGDMVYKNGSATEFRDLYEPTWGTFKAITAPTVGNHEYQTHGATGYYDYFGELAGPDRRGYYSFDLGAWHLISLNSEVMSKMQLNWLVQDLKATNKKCILAYWHKPLYSSGTEHGNNPLMRVFWERLYESGADVVLNGHDHDYERFAKQNPFARADQKGIREFVVGTGGAGERSFTMTKPNSEVRATGEFGVLEITLKDDSYDAEFKSAEGSTFTDKISNQKCNN